MDRFAKFMIQLVLFLVLAITSFYFSEKYWRNETKQGKLSFCNAKIDNKLIDVREYKGFLNLTLESDEVYDYCDLVPWDSNHNALLKNFIFMVKPGDKFIKKAKADNFITVRGTDTLTWHVDCPY